MYDPTARLSRLLEKSTGNAATKYVYGLGLIGEETAGEFKTYHYDYRGSTVAITSEDGEITDTFEYDTYGKLLSHDGTTDTPFLYNGRDGVMTEPNGLYYMRARYYSPDLKRFINADIIPGDITNCITLNRYAYANNNPAMFVDPLGLSAENWLKFAIGGALIVALAVITVTTLGTATGIIAGAALTGAVVNGTMGAITGYVEGGWESAADEFLVGSVVGAASGMAAAYGLHGAAAIVCDVALNVGETYALAALDGTINEITVTEVIVDVATGLVLGYLCDDGMFYENKTFSDSIDSYENALAKEGRRANQDYAQKQTKRIRTSYKETTIDELAHYGKNEVKENILSEALKVTDSSSQRRK